MFDGFVEELAKIQKAKIEGDKTDDTLNTKNEEDRSRPSTSYTQEHSSRPSTSYTEDTAYSKQSPSHTEEVDKKADLQIVTIANIELIKSIHPCVNTNFSIIF